ncbi:hypothetical protein [Bradyrhizobium sp. WSM1743]|uniref:hypothetical protein n=1 Tax=Bradyrhizobium sp. WSM1743 TaxID=318996 RepID=UPI00042752C0|nr:hypothetical protein [Bradyrhizobium sp. WSM1743]
MEQRETIPKGDSGAAPQPPSWMHRTAPYAPDRRAKMLEHMARARSLPQRQAASAQPPGQLPLAAGMTILGDAFGYAVLFGIMALLFQSRIPLYLGAFLFLTDGARIEAALAAIGIRFEAETIGPDIIKGFSFWFAWIALLASVSGSVPAWLAPWPPPAETWSSIAGIALLLAIFDALAALIIRRTSPWFGLAITPDSLISTAIKFITAFGVLALLVLLGAL